MSVDFQIPVHLPQCFIGIQNDYMSKWAQRMKYFDEYSVVNKKIS